LLDLGCGDGRLLCGLLDHVAGAPAVAVDPSPEAIAAARRMIATTPHADRVELISGHVLDATASIDPPDVVIAAFVLQEIVGQLGRTATVEYLRRLGDRWPRARWIIIEVDHRPGDDVLRTPHGLGYYNPYYLFHPLTRQQLLPRAEWERLFAAAGFAVEQVATTDPGVDPTGLELGFRIVRR
jgi:2-ketoarginine methyltransferase